MPKTITELSEEEFASRFTLVANHLNPLAAWRGCLFETYGEELTFVANQDSRNVWTLLDGDMLRSGMRYVNRLGYLVAREPAQSCVEYLVNLAEKGGDHADRR